MGQYKNALMGLGAIAILFCLVFVFGTPGDTELSGQAVGSKLVSTTNKSISPYDKQERLLHTDHVIPIAYEDANNPDLPTLAVLYTEYSGSGELLLFDFDNDTVSRVDSNGVGMFGKLASIGHLIDYDQLPERFAETLNRATVTNEGTLVALADNEIPAISVGGRGDWNSQMVDVAAPDTNAMTVGGDQPSNNICKLYGFCYFCDVYAQCYDDCENNGYGGDLPGTDSSCRDVCNWAYEQTVQNLRDALNFALTSCDEMYPPDDIGDDGWCDFFVEVCLYGSNKLCKTRARAIYTAARAAAMAAKAGCWAGCDLGETACKFGCLVGSYTECPDDDEEPSTGTNVYEIGTQPVRDGKQMQAK